MLFPWQMVSLQRYKSTFAAPTRLWQFEESVIIWTCIYIHMWHLQNTVYQVPTLQIQFIAEDYLWQMSYLRYEETTSETKFQTQNSF